MFPNHIFGIGYEIKTKIETFKALDLEHMLFMCGTKTEFF
jgi:hypothetical protein